MTLIVDQTTSLGADNATYRDEAATAGPDGPVPCDTPRLQINVEQKVPIRQVGRTRQGPDHSATFHDDRARCVMGLCCVVIAGGCALQHRNIVHFDPRMGVKGKAVQPYLVSGRKAITAQHRKKRDGTGQTVQIAFAIGQAPFDTAKGCQSTCQGHIRCHLLVPFGPGHRRCKANIAQASARAEKASSGSYRGKTRRDNTGGWLGAGKAGRIRRPPSALSQDVLNVWTG